MTDTDTTKIIAAPPSTKRFAFVVAAGIFLSRVAGLIRDRVFAHYFGNSDAADVFKAALRIPNFLQNLFGEGVLSASFIPVYASLLAKKDEEEARKTAGAVAALLALSTSILVLLGVMAAPWLIDAIAPGFHGEKREMTVLLVRILFPGAGLLVGSAWCLGVLNSHRKFFISYTAPVLWNVAMIAGMMAFGPGRSQNSLVVITAWASVVGSALQVGVQLPMVLKLLGGLHLRLAHQAEHVRTVIRNFFPVFISRGVVQISAYIDAFLASWLPTGAVAALAYAQTLYTLPVSLFGMSVSAAELPLMSGAIGAADEVASMLRTRVNAGLRQITFLVVPSVVGFLVLGDVIVAAIYQSGRFMHADVTYVWGILAGSTVGLLASTLGRLYASGYYALREHAHAAALRHRPRGPYHHSGIFERAATSSIAGHRAAMGRRRLNDFRGNGVVGGIHAVATRLAQPPRPGRRATQVSRASLDRICFRCGAWTRCLHRHWPQKADSSRDTGLGNLRHSLLRIGDGHETSRSAIHAGHLAPSHERKIAR